jgi:hypothetical protein
MIYQLTWKILPGLRGLSCSDFRATPTAAPNTEQGVAIDCASERDCNALLQELESYFAPQRFTNNASAFETVKTYVIEKMAGKT